MLSNTEPTFHVTQPKLKYPRRALTEHHNLEPALPIISPALCIIQKETH